MPWNKQKLTSSPMRVLLDECVPRGLRAELPGHEVKTVAEAGWAGAKNGTLLELGARSLTFCLRPMMPAVLKALPNSRSQEL